MSTIKPSEDVTTLVYFSSSRVAWTESDLKELLRVSRLNNQKAGITGFLIYADGMFLQWLEGAPSSINSLYSRISSDSRHQAISPVFQGSLGARYFPRWAMAFLSREEIGEELSNDFFELTQLSANGGFLVDAPKLAQRIAGNFLRASRI